MVVYETKRFPRRINIMDMEIHYLSLIFSLSERASRGGWIQPQRGVRQGCPLALLLLVLVHESSMLAGHAQRLPNTVFQRVSHYYNTLMAQLF